MTHDSPSTLTVRLASLADLEPVDALLARSYPKLLKADYAPSVLVTAVPLISRAQPALLASQRYYVAALDTGEIVGAGGWSLAPPQGRASSGRVGHIRHVVTDHARVRQGIGRQLMTEVMDAARGAGVQTMHCQSTLTAERFYQSLGFQSHQAIEIELRPGILFPAIFMTAQL